jgi:hypothetical protein
MQQEADMGLIVKQEPPITLPKNHQAYEYYKAKLVELAEKFRPFFTTPARE